MLNRLPRGSRSVIDHFRDGETIPSEKRISRISADEETNRHTVHAPRFSRGHGHEGCYETGLYRLEKEKRFVRSLKEMTREVGNG